MALNFQNNGPDAPGRLPLIICTVLALVCVGIYGSEGPAGPLHRVQATVEGMIAPLQLAGAPLGTAVEGAQQAADNQGADEETLAALRAQNAELTRTLTQAEEYRLEAQRLQALLNLKDNYEIDGVAARVIGRSTDAWNQNITLDVGSAEGVETGLTVMGPYGVIGQVVSVAPGSCRVRLLTDPQSGAAALVQQSRAEGIVRGSLDGLLYLENIGADVNVQVGDVVLTSGLGGSYTRGLLIGTVARVEGSAGNDSRRIVVAPNDSVTLLQEALVVFSAASDAAERGVPARASDEGAEGGQDGEDASGSGNDGSSDGAADGDGQGGSDREDADSGSDAGSDSDSGGDNGSDSEGGEGA